MTDIVKQLRAEVDPDVNEPLDRLLESAADEIERLRTALGQIVETNDDFRKSMPEKWEGDPLQDAIDVAAKMVAT